MGGPRASGLAFLRSAGTLPGHGWATMAGGGRASPEPPRRGADDAGEHLESIEQPADDDASICTYTEESSLGRGSPASDTSLPDVLDPGDGGEEGRAGSARKQLDLSSSAVAVSFHEGGVGGHDPRGRVSNHMNGDVVGSAVSPLPPLSDPSSLPGSEDVTEDMSLEGTPIEMSPWPPGRTVFSSVLNGDGRRAASRIGETGVHLAEPVPVEAYGALQGVYIEQLLEVSAQPDSRAAEIQPPQGPGVQGAGSDVATAGGHASMRVSLPRVKPPQEKLVSDPAGAPETDGSGSAGPVRPRTSKAGNVVDDAKTAELASDGASAAQVPAGGKASTLRVCPVACLHLMQVRNAGRGTLRLFARAGDHPMIKRRGESDCAVLLGVKHVRHATFAGGLS